MKSYTIQSGPLKVTIVAPTAYEAALEAVRLWEVEEESSEAAHRANLDAVLEVRQRQSHRPARLFPTFNLLARARGQSPSQAWEQVLRSHIGQNN
jgi:hypothetical protein